MGVSRASCLLRRLPLAESPGTAWIVSRLTKPTRFRFGQRLVCSRLAHSRLAWGRLGPGQGEEGEGVVLRAQQARPGPLEAVLASGSSATLYSG